MKFGIRKPSWRKSLSARTKGRAKRAIKKALNQDTEKRVWVGLKILRRQHTIKFTVRLLLVFGIYLSDKQFNIL